MGRGWGLGRDPSCHVLEYTASYLSVSSIIIITSRNHLHLSLQGNRVVVILEKLNLLTVHFKCYKTAC